MEKNEWDKWVDFDGWCNWAGTAFVIYKLNRKTTERVFGTSKVPQTNKVLVVMFPPSAINQKIYLQSALVVNALHFDNLVEVTQISNSVVLFIYCQLLS